MTVVQAKGKMMDVDPGEIWNHLEWLAAVPRFAESDRLEECRQYCEIELKAAGWAVERQPFEVSDSKLNTLNGINLIARRKKTADKSQKATQKPLFILGAHLDSCEDTPGADDNASAVAVLLETARIIDQRLTENDWDSTIVDLEFVVFDLEEHGMLGAAFHAASCRQNQRLVSGMVSLEMLGYCSHESGSQRFPEQLEGLYSDVGNFIAVVGDQNSAALINHFEAAFKSVANLPSKSLQVPNSGHTLPATRLSDHSPYWDEGFAALMITDTSFLRNPHYHQPTDTPETLDRVFLHKVSQGVLTATEGIVRRGLEPCLK